MGNSSASMSAVRLCIIQTYKGILFLHNFYSALKKVNLWVGGATHKRMFVSVVYEDAKAKNGLQSPSIIREFVACSFSF